MFESLIALLIIGIFSFESLIEGGVANRFWGYLQGMEVFLVVLLRGLLPFPSPIPLIDGATGNRFLDRVPKR